MEQNLKFKRLTLVAMTPDTALASIKAGDIDIVNVSEAMAQEKIENYSILATKQWILGLSLCLQLKIRKTY